MKTVRIEISRKQYSTITVQVPDEFDAAKLHSWTYGLAVRNAAERLDPDWDWGIDGEVEVEDLTVLKGEEEAKELLDYETADLTEDLASCEVDRDALNEKAKAFLAARQANKQEDAGNG